jgi:hypothetical protein
MSGEDAIGRHFTSLPFFGLALTRACSRKRACAVSITFGDHHETTLYPARHLGDLLP